MRLTNNIILAGSGDHGGFSLTSPFDCHFYLIDGGDEWAFLDAGSGQDLEKLIARLLSLSIDTGRIRYLLLTHSHFDHAGGSRALRDQFGLKIIASKETARRLRSGDAESTGLASLQRVGLMPTDLHFEPCRVDDIAKDGETIVVGKRRIKVLATPGHSEDHLAYLLEDEHPALFSGDSIIAGGQIILQNLDDCVIKDYVKTIYRLDQLEFEMLLPGHGLLALQRGHNHIAIARAKIDHLEIPPSMNF